MYDVEEIIDNLVMAETMIENSKKKLVKMGFTVKEAEELIETYVYKPLNKED